MTNNWYMRIVLFLLGWLLTVGGFAQDKKAYIFFDKTVGALPTRNFLERAKKPI